MSEKNEQGGSSSRLSLRSGSGSLLELGKTEAVGSVRQSFSHGRSKTVQVEVVKKRQPGPSKRPFGPAATPPGKPGEGVSAPAPSEPVKGSAPPSGRTLTQAELEKRQRVLEEQRRQAAERQQREREQREREEREREAARQASPAPLPAEPPPAPSAATPAPAAAAPAPAAAEPAPAPQPPPAKAEPPPPPPAEAATTAPTLPASAPPAAPAQPAASTAPGASSPAPATPAAPAPVAASSPAASATSARSGVAGSGPQRPGRPALGEGISPQMRGAGSPPTNRPLRSETQPGPGRSSMRPEGPGASGSGPSRPAGASPQAGQAGRTISRMPPRGPDARGATGVRPAGTRLSEPVRPKVPPPPQPLLDRTGARSLGRKQDHAAEEARRRSGSGKHDKPKSGAHADNDTRFSRRDIMAALDDEDERTRSLASIRRARERERRQQELQRLRAGGERVVRDVVVPDVITVQELANRMAVRGSELVMALFRMGLKVTLTQTIDADTAQLVVEEFGHRVKRVAEDDVEQGLEGEVDAPEDLLPRPPVVTIMGHVDHGKTSLLDALRQSDVAAKEAGGITQHIGAYQVEMPGGQRITFIDTPGHEAFTALRARGAKVTDIVVLVVAADDGVMPQTVEAINHARAAGVPLIVAINKIDKPGVDPARVRNELLQHEVVVESMGGDTLEVEVSALKRINLDKLAEAIQLQADVMELRANPNRPGAGTVIEAKLDRGRGPVATVLVQRGTLRQGDIVVAGAEWGRVRALVNDKGQPVKEAGPSTPVEVLGLSGVPSAGERLIVVESEARAKEIYEFRQRRLREKQAAALGANRSNVIDMMKQIAAGEQKEVAVVVKADVQGSAEAINATLAKLGTEEVRVRVLHSAVGQITETDVQLAKASNAIIIGFNVRPTTQARAMAQRDGVDIRYYSIIYDVAEDVEKLVKGKLAPIQREKILGYAKILQVFEIKRVGNIAGCRVTEGVVRRGCGVRLLRDGVVIHTGELATLRRFKDDVKEVTNGYECGMSFANYNDIRVGDVIECFETETVAAA
ncbi:MAG: translation initiation factor IF-2 [Rhodovarius sp.]|nr:translation initiation factor IF-2 [Rhodovarius sp.]